MSFQIACQIFQVASLVTLRIAAGRIHISFTVHYFIIRPINNGTTGHACFEYIWVTKEQGGSHVSSETPPMHSNAVAVYIGQAFQELNSFHLIFSLFNA
ncbi:hypothetical protein SDC9_193186 [bioreactor metagenome]|uniref:Uncharacterized protein n=1 Tax=bioreactor metagenome TaxID=1076179 RepID=A0A645I2Z0_9ZZZZ